MQVNVSAPVQANSHQVILIEVEASVERSSHRRYLTIYCVTKIQ